MGFCRVWCGIKLVQLVPLHSLKLIVSFTVATALSFLKTGILGGTSHPYILIAQVFHDRVGSWCFFYSTCITSKLMIFGTVNLWKWRHWKVPINFVDPCPRTLRFGRDWVSPQSFSDNITGCLGKFLTTSSFRRCFEESVELKLYRNPPKDKKAMNGVNGPTTWLHVVVATIRTTTSLDSKMFNRSFFGKRTGRGRLTSCWYYRGWKKSQTTTLGWC